MKKPYILLEPKNGNHFWVFEEFKKDHWVATWSRVAPKPWGKIIPDYVDVPSLRDLYGQDVTEFFNVKRLTKAEFLVEVL